MSQHLPPVRQKTVPLLRDYLDFLQNPLEFWVEVAQEAPVIRIAFTALLENWVVSDPAFAQHILQKKAKTYVRDRRLMKIHRMGRPEYSFNTPDWDEWLRRRRLMQPAFHRNELRGFADVMVGEAASLAEEMLEAGTVNLEHRMKQLTMCIIAQTMFSTHLEAADFQESYDVWTDYIFERTTRAFQLPHWVPTAKNRYNRTMIEKRESILRGIVQARHASQTYHGDLLDRLIAARLEDGTGFTLAQLVRELDGIVFAGHDTTALTLTWFFYLLAQYPAVEARLHQEIADTIGERPVTLADLEQMPYTLWTIQETLRQHPPVYATIRENLEADDYGDYHIPANTSLIINIRGLHYSDREWQNPAAFMPERFSPENSAKRHSFAFLPFIAGPRKCMGDHFAMMELQLVIPTLLQQLRFRRVDDMPVKPRASFVAKPERDILMQVQGR